MSENTELIIYDDNDKLESAELYFQDFQQKTIKEVIEEFLKLKNSEQTKRAYRNDIKEFFLKLNVAFLKDLGNIPYHEIVKFTMKHINSFRKAEKYYPDRVINAKTVNRKAYAISAFFKFLINVYNYPKNPVANFTPLKVHRRSTTTSCTRAEIFEVLESLKKKKEINELGFRNYLMFLFMFLLALRRNEIANLQWKDLNKDRQSITVFQKGGTYKELPLPDNLLKLLFEFKEKYGKHSSYIFHPVVNNRTGDTKKPVSTDLIFKIVREEVSKILPDKNITPHSFRKTFIEQALNNNQDFISIINATGHTSIEMVKYYDTRDKLKNNAINNMGNIF
ncbi:MAG: site-specific integrase [Candidatus Sericytochromatia bacterium]